MFWGQYNLKINNGCILFPWSIDTNNSFTWYLSEAYDRKNLIIYITQTGVPDPEFDHVLEEGAFTLDEQGQWQLPQTFLEAFGDQDIVICGVNEYFEVCTEAYFEQQIQMIDDLFEEIDLSF